MQMFIGGDLTLPNTDDAMAVAILSDGARELIVSVDLERGAEAADLPATAIASPIDTDATDAEAIAGRIVRTSRTAGLSEPADESAPSPSRSLTHRHVSRMRSRYRHARQ